MALFPPQHRDWALPIEAPLTPKALLRVSRECVEGSYDCAAAALNEDWGSRFDGRDLQRWTEKIGARLVRERDAQVTAYTCGQRISAPENAPALLVIGVDGGRVQTQERDPETGSRWREDKVATITSYVPGDGAEIKPQALVTTHVATMEKCGPFGPMARTEAAHRGYAHAAQTIAIADCGEWIDPLLEREFPGIERIADWAHAEEYLYEAGRASFGAESPEAKAFSENCADLLYESKVEKVLEALREQSNRLGKPRKSDGPQHPRRKLATALGYIEKNKRHMDYARYLKNGWPIGSGNVEAGVKQFNKRVKGTEQFWSYSGVEAVLALRALLLSQDGRWSAYWSRRPAYLKTAA
jgi:hypothetical protein